MTQPDELLPCYICDGKGSFRCADMRCYCVADRHKCGTCKGTGKIRSARPTPRIDDQVDLMTLRDDVRKACPKGFAVTQHEVIDYLTAHYNLTRKD